MPRYAAFLRGINVGGRRVKSPDLCAPFERLGHTDVVSFRASGNVVFDAGSDGVPELTRAIERALEDALGFEVATMLRTKAQVRAIAAKQPFDSRLVETSTGKLQVLLLAKKPSAATRRKAIALATEADKLSISSSELYWLPSGGTQDSELDQAELGRLLGTATMRTKGTIEQIASKYFS